MNEIRLADFRAESLQFDMNHHFQPKDNENLQLSIKLDQRVRMSSTPKEPVFLNIRVTVFDNAEVNNYPFEIIADVTGVFFIEANIVPGMSEASIIPKQAQCFGVSLSRLFEMAIENVL